MPTTITFEAQKAITEERLRSSRQAQIARASSPARRHPVAKLLAVVGLLVLAAWWAPTASAAPSTTVDFSYSNAAQSWTAPAGVHQATFDLFGSIGNGDGGAGGETMATIAVSPGQTYWIITGGVAQAGNPFLSTPPPSSAGGGGGSFPAGGSGGGATDLRTDPGDVATRLLVAGGGGGGGGPTFAREGAGEIDLSAGTGGIGGLHPTAGTAGQLDGSPVIYPGGGGGGAATSSAPGVGGSSPVTGEQGHDGSGSLGGNGGYAYPYEVLSPSGGGGGGGCYGGGGGGSGFNEPRATDTSASGGGAGGGGTSCVYATTLGPPTYNDGVSRQLGHATVTFETPQDQAISAQGRQPVGGTEAISNTSTVATFTDPDTSASAGEYSATIDWGDGSPSSAGTITGGGGSFSVTGSHTYADEGHYLISVTISDVDDQANAATVTDTASIADAALTAGNVSQIVSPAAVSGTVAAFSDANPTASSAEFTATIDWGDGSPTSNGTVTGSDGSYTVTGAHTYSGTGPFVIRTHIADDGGSSADAQTSVVVYANSSNGSFVIGDQGAADGSAVTFWGARWSKLNGLSGGSAPASFKGFADTPATAGCGSSWTAHPGDSGPLPSGPLPAYMAVIVSGTVSKSGPSISGDTKHLVVVKTNPGYEGNPDHPGTGTVVATVC